MTIKDYLSMPDLTQSTNPFDRSDRLWARNHPKRCATCGAVYFGYIHEDGLWEPYSVDPDPAPGMGKRGTCGDPKCLEIELRYQDRRDPRVKRAQEAYDALHPDQHHGQTDVPILKKAGT